MSNIFQLVGHIIKKFICVQVTKFLSLVTAKLLTAKKYGFF